MYGVWGGEVEGEKLPTRVRYVIKLGYDWYHGGMAVAMVKARLGNQERVKLPRNFAGMSKAEKFVEEVKVINLAGRYVVSQARVFREPRYTNRHGISKVYLNEVGVQYKKRGRKKKGAKEPPLPAQAGNPMPAVGGAFKFQDMAAVERAVQGVIAQRRQNKPVPPPAPQPAKQVEARKEVIDPPEMIDALRAWGEPEHRDFDFDDGGL